MKKIKEKYVDFQWRRDNKDIWGITLNIRCLSNPIALSEILILTNKRAKLQGIDFNDCRCRVTFK